MSPRHPEATGQVLGRLSSALADLGVTEFALTGGVALGVWAAPRQTHDIDLCGVLPLAAVDPLLARHDGIRSGPEELPDLVRFRIADWDIDLFVCKSPYDRVCLDRAVEAEVEGLRLRVVSAEDLAIHKMIKLRTDRRRVLQDVADLRALFATRGRQMDWAYLRQWLPTQEAELLASLATLDDEALLARLLGR